MQGDPRQAIALFDEALQRGTTKPELAYYSRAIANEVAGDAKAAYLDYRRAAQAAPKWSEPRQQLSRFTVAKASASNF
jgi:Tfp pilus assembly protein PilF